MSTPPGGFVPLRTRARGWATRYFSSPVARALVALHITANMITVAGFFVSAISAYLISEGGLVVGGVVMLAGAIMDMFDGTVARLTGSASRFGAYLDSVLDRLGEAVVLFGLLVFYVHDSHELGAFLAFGTVVLSIMVSYTRARAEGLDVQGDVGFMGRPERIVVMGAGLLLQLPEYAMAIIMVGSVITIAQRSAHVRRNT
ncbi:MAG: CDP-alcohol phosphatidyltransferase family protein [Chloroflexi bacterium]|nr:CDP-alcohol phosphatidyltransferase family protein [Chloroflexota bacterium]